MQQEVVNASKIRKIIAKRMTQSWNCAPRVAYTKSIDVEPMKKFRAEVNGQRDPSNLP